MTSAERVIAAARGGPVDRRPEIVLGLDAGDVRVVSLEALARTLGGDDRPVLVDIGNPFFHALKAGLDLNRVFREEPAEGHRRLENLVSRTAAQMEAALDGGADGVLYRLHGATERHCSPMQYGGYYLEHDRELLANIAEARLNVLYVAGETDVYLDFVSDLPAHVFAWDSATTGVSAAAVREMRPGAQASMDPESDFALTIHEPYRLHTLEKIDFALGV